MIGNPLEGDPSVLFDIAEDYSRWSGALDVVTTRRAAIQQLSFVSALPLHVLMEGIAADVSVNDRAVDPSMVTHIDSMIDVVRTEGGWFGADPTSPLADSIWASRVPALT